MNCRKNKKYEIYLFIDPLGINCYRAEQTVQHFRRERNEDICVRIIPMINYDNIKSSVKKRSILKKGSPLEMQNQLRTNTFQAALAYKAASMQGRKKGYLLLLALQEAVVNLRDDFSVSLVMDIAGKLNLDLHEFVQDFHSDFAKECFYRDQQIAREMGITKTPSCVIMNTTKPDQIYRLDHKIEERFLTHIFKEIGEQTEKEPTSHLTLMPDKWQEII